MLDVYEPESFSDEYEEFIKAIEELDEIELKD
jgi:hypothetical protein